MAYQDKKIVLVTGANQGIGFQIAKLMASTKYPDYYVVVGCRDFERGKHAVVQMAEELGGVNTDAEAIQLDITDDESVAQCAALLKEKHGRLDVLINNAGILMDSKVSPTYPFTAVLSDTLATNTIGAARVTDALLPLLMQAPQPRIVMMSSTAGSLSRYSHLEKTYTTVKYSAPAYFCSKAALNMLMLWYKNSLPGKFKVNASCPGFRPTNLCGFDERAGPLEEGAWNAVRLATLGDEGETGTFSNLAGPIAW